MDQDLNRKINALSDEQAEALVILIIEMFEHKDKILKLIGTQDEYLKKVLVSINNLGYILPLPYPPVRRIIPAVVRRILPQIAENYPKLSNFPAEMNTFMSETSDMISQMKAEIKSIKDIEAAIAKLLM